MAISNIIEVCFVHYIFNTSFFSSKNLLLSKRAHLHSQPCHLIFPRSPRFTLQKAESQCPIGGIISDIVGCVTCLQSVLLNLHLGPGHLLSSPLHIVGVCNFVYRPPLTTVDGRNILPRPTNEKSTTPEKLELVLPIVQSAIPIIKVWF